MKQHDTFWDWKVGNAFTIIVVLLTWAFSFGILYTRIDYIAKNIEEQKQMWLQTEKRLGFLEINDAANEVKITALETANNLRK